MSLTATGASTRQWVEAAKPGIRSLRPYQPGKPIEELAREQGLSVDTIVKLASNENPLGPAPSVLSAMRSAFADLSRYPDANGFALKAALSEKLGVEPARITLGNGSNDILVLLAEAYLGPGLSAVYSEYAFFVYSLVTQAFDAQGIEVPSTRWGHDLTAMAAALRPDTRMVFLANPNNPTGTHFSQTELVTFLESVPEDVLVILDEAYFEYMAVPETMPLVDRFSNLVITRTFSKAYGLAGCRVGYSVSHPDVADILNRIRQPFNVNNLGLVAAEAALKDTDYLARSRQINQVGMAFLQSGFDAMGLMVIPSVCNFLCVDVGCDALPVYEAMLAQGVIVRPVNTYGMPRHLRISIGVQKENERCLEVLKAVL